MSRADRAARDPRLDFFRGLAMFIIVIAHVPDNPWTLWIPARFGFSDATEIFVFCSGMASAIAFGGSFARRGWAIGTARVLFRVWQVYWAHIGTFLAVAALTVLLNRAGLGRDYVGQLNLGPFFDDPAAGLVGLLTLGYVPNYFDILPMYLVILALIPAVIGLAEVARPLAATAVLALWLAANLGGLALPAEPWSDRAWFFNPFGWQLLFFTGFALMAGWLPAPPVRRGLVWLAAAVVAATVPLAWFRILRVVPGLREAAEALAPLTAKTPFGALRFLHFLAIAYLAWVAVGPLGARLQAGRTRARVTGVIRAVGQQSLAVFVAGLVLSRLLGVAMDLWGRGPLAALAINAVGAAAVVAIAYGVAWIKGEPWRKPAPEPRAPTGEAGQSFGRAVTKRGGAA